MFHTARRRLTGWYLLIIMLVSLTFSGVIYRESSLELERFALAQRSRFERRLVIFDAHDQSTRSAPPMVLDTELLEETKARILLSLFFINLGIAALAGILGYYLSGKTLAPIQEMLDEQYRFVTDASHELKTPITAIKTTLEVALRDPHLEVTEARKTLADSLAETNRLQKLAEGLLELSQTTGVTLTPLSITPVVREAVHLITPLSAAKKIRVKVSVSARRLMLEPTRLTRALVAVLDNAIKYSPVGSVIAVAGRPTGTTYTVTITDHGSGIPSADIDHIFERFYRSDHARSRRGVNGYGLGLAIARQIMSEHHGTITALSQKRAGTVVTITLPYSAKLQRKSVD